MLKIYILIFYSLFLYGNDSEYYTSGNQLVPLTSNNIRLDTEVLTIRRDDNNKGHFFIDVLYTLFNEGKSKNTLIGFEAPIREDEGMPNTFFYNNYNDDKLLSIEKKAIQNNIIGTHSDIKNFTILVNGKKSKYKVVSVDKIKKDENTSPLLSYLYYFPVKLKKGKNILHQTYYFIGESDMYHRYIVSYILETAKRWKGGKIGDFKLILDMGEYENFIVSTSFYKDKNYWSLEDGEMSYVEANASSYTGLMEDNSYYKFHIRTGKAIFHKKNFIPNSAIFLGAELKYNNIIFDYKDNSNLLNFSLSISMPFITKDINSLKILQALGFARKGLIFNDIILSTYYKSLDWYIPKIDDKNSIILADKDKKNIYIIKKYKYKILRNLPFAKRGYLFKDINLNIYYKTYPWYKQNKLYISSLNDLTTKEKLWRSKVLKLKEKINDKTFIYLFNEYQTLSLNPKTNQTNTKEKK